MKKLRLNVRTEVKVGPVPLYGIELVAVPLYGIEVPNPIVKPKPPGGGVPIPP